MVAIQTQVVVDAVQWVSTGADAVEIVIATANQKPITTQMGQVRLITYSTFC